MLKKLREPVNSLTHWVGAALALKGSGRLPVAICGDGDYLMGVTALWTAAHYRLPLLMVMQILQSTYALNFASFTASVLGLILGITGAARYVGGHRK